MSAATRQLRLVPDVGAGDDDGGLTPLEQWELYMRGAGRSNRTITETIGVLRRLERFSGTRVESVRPLDIARFLGRSKLKQNSRAAYFGYIHSFYRWWWSARKFGVVLAPLEAGDVVLAHYVKVAATRAPLGARVGVNRLRVIGEPAAAVAWRRDRF